MGAIYLRPIGGFPCQWEDLVNRKMRTIATVYTKKEAEAEGLGVGIARGSDGVYDIVIDAQYLTAQLVRDSLAELSRIAGQEYRLELRPSRALP